MKFYIAKTHIFLALMVGLSSMAWANPAATLTGFAKLEVRSQVGQPRQPMASLYPLKLSRFRGFLVP